MRAPGFWWRPGSPLSAILAPLGALYGSVAARRMSREGGAPPPAPLVCVGNFVAGGAGKTPTAIALARLAVAHGRTPAFLTRGHGGRLPGPVLVDPAVHGAGDVGDEALLLADVAPTVVSRDRPAAFPLLSATGADLLVMDDGFQNPSVAKTLSLVVADGAVGIGTGRPMPAGPLRAPLPVQMALADAVVILGDGPGADDVVRRAARAGRPVLRARAEPRGYDPLAGRRVVAVAGIGRPSKLFDALEAAGAAVVARRAFADHHAFTGLEAREILAEADALGATVVLTDKDAARLRHAPPGPLAELAAASVPVGVDCVFEDEAQVVRLLGEARTAWLATR